MTIFVGNIPWSITVVSLEDSGAATVYTLRAGWDSRAPCALPHQSGPAFPA
jgi:hypothetical protein